MSYLWFDFQAAEHGNTKWLTVLLQFNCDVNSLTKDGKERTPVMLAAQGGFLHCVKLLIAFKADLTAVDNEHKSCLELCSTASGRGCLRAIRQGLGLFKFLKRIFPLLKQMKEGKKEKRVKVNGRWQTQLVDIDNLSTTNYPCIETKERDQITDWNSFLHPLYRNWISIENSFTSESFRILSYNILAQCYTKPSYFPWASLDQLDWGFRSKQLLQEILSYTADIICLQELDNFEFFKENLQNYQGVYKKRANTRKDGCGIFFDSTKFTLVEMETMDFPKENIVLLVCLESCLSKKRFTVVTSHFYYKSKLIRNQQADFCIDKAQKSLLEGKPVVLCGDFNCMPDNDTIEKFQSFGLCSGYQDLMNCNQFATFLGGKHSKKWYDYIFHSKTFKATSILSLPKCGETLLPNTQLSSDHLALVSDISFTE